MLLERRKNPLRRFTQNSLKGRERSISYIYCERLNRLLRNLNDLTMTTGVRRGKSKDGTLSKRLEKPHSHLEQNLDLQLLASSQELKREQGNLGGNEGGGQQLIAESGGLFLDFGEAVLVRPTDCAANRKVVATRLITLQ